MKPFRSVQAAALNGDISVPGDKSISHRSVMLGSLAIGQTRVKGLLEGEDVLATAQAFRQLGAKVEKQENGDWLIDGVGIGGLVESDDVLDMGNSGTAARLLLGVLAAHDITSFMTGDGSLRKRPMKRVTNPLSEMGAEFVTRSEGRLPLVVTGRSDLLPTEYRLPVASAQVKSAVLLAGLCSNGQTSVIEKTPTRDHTERMLKHFGGEVTKEKLAGGEVKITVTGRPELKAADLYVPADPSSAAFPIAAAAMIPGSDVTVRGVGMNVTRTGLFTTLAEMGADIESLNERIEGGEPVADLHIKYAPLNGVEVPEERAASMIDEYPILSMVAATAKGQTVMRGVGELRVKESDRLAAVADGLRANGVTVEDGPDWMIVHGMEDGIEGGARVETFLDHRIAMSFLILGSISKKPVEIDDVAPIETSFPGFVELMTDLGTSFSAADQ